MFSKFYYLLRNRGLDISPNEWMSLLDGMQKGLHNSTLTGFYNLCRAVLIKSEAQFDRFDSVFLEYFKDVPNKTEIPPEILSWVNNPLNDLRQAMKEISDLGLSTESFNELLKLLEARIKEQKEEHNGGNKWVGTGGTSPFGNNGWHPNGIRIGGEGRYKTAMAVAGERKYRDFRLDNKLDTRSFQTAFRSLRQLSVINDSSEKEIDVDNTIRKTCDNAGNLKIEYKKPRKNNVKVILLMDSGGSMDYYSNLCSMLFQAATKANNFKELHTYYFHNCIYDNLYNNPRLYYQDTVPTETLFTQFDSSYKIIIVGDAAMSPYELTEPQYNWSSGKYGTSGIKTLKKLKQHFPYLVWLNPEPMPKYMGFWSQTHLEIAELIKMYDLSADGISSAMKALMVKK